MDKSQARPVDLDESDLGLSEGFIGWWFEELSDQFSVPAEVLNSLERPRSGDELVLLQEHARRKYGLLSRGVWRLGKSGKFAGLKFHKTAFSIAPSVFS